MAKNYGKNVKTTPDVDMDKFTSQLLLFCGLFRHVRVEKKQYRATLLHISNFQVLPRKNSNFLGSISSFNFLNLDSSVKLWNLDNASDLVYLLPHQDLLFY